VARAKALVKTVIWRVTSRIERRFGRIETASPVELEELGLASPERSSYAASGWYTLRRILGTTEVTETDVFVDYGCGKGRVLLQAARYPFARVLGVEVSEELAEVARLNVSRRADQVRCKHVEVITADAMVWDVPDDVTVVFLYNPFRRTIFSAVLERILASVDRAPRRLRVIYRTPLEHDAVLATGRFRLMRTRRGPIPWSSTSSTRMYEAIPAPPTP
jgi:SAM-dependent methyltransferase